VKLASGTKAGATKTRQKNPIRHKHLHYFPIVPKRKVGEVLDWRRPADSTRARACQRPRGCKAILLAAACATQSIANYKLPRDYARRAADASNNRSVVTGRQDRDQRRFEIVLRRDACSFNIRLLTLLPVIVAAQQRTLAVIKSQRRIGRKFVMPEPVREGPRARTRISFAPVAPPKIIPPIMTLSPYQQTRVLMFASCESVVA